MLHADGFEKILPGDVVQLSANEVDLFAHGPNAMEAMLRAIEEANSHIHLEMYIYRSVKEGEMGDRFAQALLKKQKQGVEVRLLYDPMGSRTVSRSYFASLAKQGIHVLEYNPVNPARMRGGWHPNRRDHRKLLIVDGRIAIIGGIDISEHYAEHTYERVQQGKLPPEKGGWHDVDVRIEGPAVATLQRLFLATWQRQGGKPLEGQYFPPVQERGKQLAGIALAHPGPQRNQIHEAYLHAIENAVATVHIMNAYFVPDEGIRTALCRAAERGVDVTLLLQGVSDFETVIHAQRYYYGDLLEAGMRIFELREQFLHAKAAVIDGHRGTVGSYNLDRRSMLHAEEANIIILDQHFCSRLESLFQNDLARAEPISLSEWSRRPWRERIVQRLANSVQHWL